MTRPCRPQEASEQPIIPAGFLCPITTQLMKEPVMSKYGHHYERSAIMKHLDDGKHFCPVTGHPLRPSNLVSNKTLQWKIKLWAKKANGGMHRYEASKSTTNMATQVKNSVVGFMDAPPSRFLCPLTQACMKDPVMTKHGVNFERKAILKWLDCAAEELCPVTHTPLYRRMLVSDSKLQWEIAQWHMAHGTVEIGNNDIDMSVSSITSYMTDMSLYSSNGNSHSNSNTSSSMEECASSHNKLSGSERVSRDMSIVTSLVRNLPTTKKAAAAAAENSATMDKADLLDALDTAISCSLRAAY